MILTLIALALLNFAAGFVTCFKLMERHGWLVNIGYGEIRMYGHPLRRMKGR